MQAAKTSSVENGNTSKVVSKIGVIAGGGSLPEMLLHALDKKNIEPFVVAFENQTDPQIVQGRNHIWSRLGAAGKIIECLHAHSIKDLVLIGSIYRPSLLELKPDLRTAQFFAKLSFKKLGDNSLLSALRAELEKEGFTLQGIQTYAQDLLMPAGCLGKHSPQKADWDDIERGVEVSQTLGICDVGQSVVVQQGIVIGVEAIEGTDQLLKRVRPLLRKGRGGILIKTCKPQQDKDFDLPTIGPRTLKLAYEAGLVGVVAQAHNALLIDQALVIELANKNKLFVLGKEI